jgi:hypothetical protein
MPRATLKNQQIIRCYYCEDIISRDLKEFIKLNFCTNCGKSLKFVWYQQGTWEKPKKALIQRTKDEYKNPSEELTILSINEGIDFIIHVWNEDKT